MDFANESLKKHYEWRGKIEVSARVPVDSAEALSLAYTPGVAQACLEIQKNLDKSYELTRRWNTVAVVTDGTAVLGLGNIGLRPVCLSWRGNAFSSNHLEAWMPSRYASDPKMLKTL